MSGYTYFLRDPHNGTVKVGRSDWPPARVYDVGRALGRSVELLHYIPGDHERRFHLYLRDSHVGGEWFAMTPRLQGILDGLETGATDLSILPAATRMKRSFWRKHV